MSWRRDRTPRYEDGQLAARAGIVAGYIAGNVGAEPPRYDFPALPYSIEEKILADTENGRDVSAVAGAVLVAAMAILAHSEKPIGVEVYSDPAYGMLMTRVRTVGGAVIDHAEPLLLDRVPQLATEGIAHLIDAEMSHARRDGLDNPVSPVSFAAGTGL